MCQGIYICNNVQAKQDSCFSSLFCIVQRNTLIHLEIPRYTWKHLHCGTTHLKRSRYTLYWSATFGEHCNTCESLQFGTLHNAPIDLERPRCTWDDLHFRTFQNKPEMTKIYSGRARYTNEDSDVPAKTGNTWENKKMPRKNKTQT